MEPVANQGGTATATATVTRGGGGGKGRARTRYKNKNKASGGGEGGREAGARREEEGDRRKLKALVRRLPPELTEENFRKQVEEEGYGERVAWMRYWKGEPKSKAGGGQGSGAAQCSRCYLQFKNPQTIQSFHKAFHGHAYATDKGQTFVAAVSLAPNQRCPKPKNRRRRDPKAGTIEDDADYKAFVEALSEQTSLPTGSQSQAEQKEAEDGAPVITPLMLYMKKKAAQRVAKLRSRPSKKKAEKKKGGKKGNRKHGGSGGKKDYQSKGSSSSGGGAKESGRKKASGPGEAGGFQLVRRKKGGSKHSNKS